MCTFALGFIPDAFVSVPRIYAMGKQVLFLTASGWTSPSGSASQLGGLGPKMCFDQRSTFDVVLIPS